MTTPVRVAHVVSHPIEYFAPLYRELARRPELDLTVLFCSDATVREFYDPGFGREIAWELPLLDGYRSRFPASATGRPLTGRFLRGPNWDVVREVVSGRYDVVWAHGYGHPTTWLAAAAARAARLPVLLREEQVLLHRRAWHRRALKQVALRLLFASVWGLYIGEENRRYFRHYGLPEARLFPARYCVDNGFFRAEAERLTARRAQVRRSFGVTDDAPVVLFSGKLVERKQPLLLLEAFAHVRERHRCWLLVAGDGPQRGALAARAAQLGLGEVLVTGFLNQTELPAAYAAADLLVLPSVLEPWGLVVNEAMNFGLPVIASDAVGCAADLVRPGWNGFVVPRRDAAALTTALGTLVADEGLRRSFGARSLDVVGEYSLEACADGIVEACLACARETVPRAIARAATGLGAASE